MNDYMDDLLEIKSTDPAMYSELEKKGLLSDNALVAAAINHFRKRAQEKDIFKTLTINEKENVTPLFSYGDIFNVQIREMEKRVDPEDCFFEVSMSGHNYVMPLEPKVLIVLKAMLKDTNTDNNIHKEQMNSLLFEFLKLAVNLDNKPVTLTLQRVIEIMKSLQVENPTPQMYEKIRSCEEYANYGTTKITDKQ